MIRQTLSWTAVDLIEPVKGKEVAILGIWGKPLHRKITTEEKIRLVSIISWKKASVILKMLTLYQSIVYIPYPDFSLVVPTCTTSIPQG